MHLRPRLLTLAGVLLVLTGLTSCSGGDTGPFVAYDVDGTYLTEVRIVESNDPYFDVGEVGTAYLTFVTRGNGVEVASSEGDDVLRMRRERNTLSYVGAYEGCDSVMRLTWSSSNRFTGSGRDDCYGSVVRYTMKGERTTD